MNSSKKGNLIAYTEMETGLLAVLKEYRLSCPKQKEQ